MPSNRSRNVPTSDTLRLTLLGAPRLAIGDAPVSVDTRKATAIVAYLALDGGPVARGTLAALLWPEYDDEHARGALRRTLSTLRGALRGGWLRTVGDLVSLHPDRLDVDLAQARSLALAVRTHRHRNPKACSWCRARLTEAASLHRGDFMAGFALRDSPEWDDWQALRADEVRRELATLLEMLADSELAAGSASAALEHAMRWLALDPLDEAAHRAVMRIHAQRGDRAAAMRQYRACVRILDEELGVSPVPETSALYQAIAEGQVATSQEDGTVATPDPTAEVPGRLALVGRGAELASLAGAYARVATDGHLVAMVGEPGIGKSRLLAAVADVVREAGGRTVSVRSHEGESALAYGPISEAIEVAIELLGERLGQSTSPRALAELSILAPQLGALTNERPSRVGDPAATLRLFETVTDLLTAAVAGPVPGALLFDDAQWADPASTELLAYLARRLTGRPILLVAAFREESTESVALLRRALAEGVASGSATQVKPRRLTRDDVAVLAAALVRPGDGEGGRVDLLDRLQAETDGVPLLVVEYLFALARNELGAGADSVWRLPASLGAVLAARLELVPAATRQVAETAAVIGRGFDVDLVRQASGRNASETMAALDHLVARGILRETGEAPARGYEFRHDAIRELLDQWLTAARRRLLHARVSSALIRRDRGMREGNAFASVIAQHLQLAGRDRLAGEYHRRAGDRARRVHANAEAAEHFRQALALGADDQSGLHEAIGDLETLRGDYPVALQAYEAAAASAGGERMAAIEEKLGLLHGRRGSYVLAETGLSAALSATPDDDLATRARLLAERSLLRNRRGDARRAVADADDALRLAVAADEPQALARAHNAHGILASGRDSEADARTHFERSLAFASALTEPATRIAALNNLALTHRAAGDIAAAIELTEEALRLCAASGDRHRQAALHNNLADLLHGTGRRDEARDELRRAVTLFAEIGEPGTLQPEIWKLVEW